MGRRSVLLVGGLAALAACTKRGEGQGEGGAAKVTLALDWVPEPEFGGFYAAREGGGYRRRGLDVEIRGGGAGVPVVQMVAAGQAHFGIAGADEVLMARGRGVDVVPVYATFQKHPQAIMAHAARGHRTLGEVVKGGTLAIEPGLPYVAFLKKKFGGFGAQIVPYDGGVARFLVEPAFAQQCFATSEPLAARKKGGDPQVFLVADEGFNPYAAVVITSRAVLRDHAAWVKGFVEASREGWGAYLADPGPVNAVMAKLNPSMDAETFASAAAAQRPLIEGDDPAKTPLGSMTVERWQTLGRQLVELGLIGSVPPVESFLVAPP